MWELQFFKVFTKYMIETQCHQQRFIFVGFIPKVNWLFRINVEKIGTWLAFLLWKITFYNMKTSISSNNQKIWISHYPKNVQKEWIFSIKDKWNYSIEFDYCSKL